MKATTRMYTTISKEGERAYVSATKRKYNGKDVIYIRPSGPRLRHGQRVFVVESQYEGDYTLTTIFRQQKHAEQWYQAITPAADEVPHCTSCEENPAAENDELCQPCALIRDAQPVRQENAETPFRAGSGDVLTGQRPQCTFQSPPTATSGCNFQRIEHDDKRIQNEPCSEYDALDVHGTPVARCWRPRGLERWRCVEDRYAGPPVGTGDTREEALRELIRQRDDSATFSRMDDGYRKQAFFARASAVALALTLALGIGSASAAETLTYTSPTSGRTLTLPFIGTEQYSDSCTITHAWEDGSALASCWEDGATYAYDADGKFFTNHGIVFHYGEPGWYVAEGGTS